MTSTTACLRPLTETGADIPEGSEVRGSHCRTSKDLFGAWATALGFPDYFGHNWDAFHDCLRDCLRGAVPTTVVVREAGDLLVDEPESVLALLIFMLSRAAGDDSTAPRFVLLLDDTPDSLSQLARRMEQAGITVPTLRNQA
nr:barstar family protein [Streptomyces sp. S3(2020)]